jgi:hypothetical protein
LANEKPNANRSAQRAAPVPSAQQIRFAELVPSNPKEARFDEVVF